MCFSVVVLKYTCQALHITTFNQRREIHGDNYVFEVEQEKYLLTVDKKLNLQNGALDKIEVYSLY